MFLEEQKEGIERGGEFLLESTLRGVWRELERAKKEFRLLKDLEKNTDDVASMERISWQLEQISTIIDSIKTDEEEIASEIKSLLEKKHLDHFKKSIN